MTNKTQAVLFDLDGTFADTAPDLAYALNTLLEENDRPALPLEPIRLQTSNGTNALLKLGFNIDPGHIEFNPLRDRLLAIYEANIAKYTTLFDGIEKVIDQLDDQNIPWGIVTNKPEKLTQPLMEQLELNLRAKCIVSGDTTAHAKPHPEPMFYAAKLIDIQPHHCLYIGDAARDIEAGRNAGMRTLVALFGYLGADDFPEQWNATGMIKRPEEILEWL